MIAARRRAFLDCAGLVFIANLNGMQQGYRCGWRSVIFLRRKLPDGYSNASAVLGVHWLDRRNR
jgi:hypothetical protein